MIADDNTECKPEDWSGPRRYTATLVMLGEGGRVTLETGEHASAAEAMAALASLVHRLKPKDRG